ncbi:hypothetical protein HW532_18380 [Kaustia mangrovi]|uniref:Uncharacterized protein n=1 Tax=Kaustia mangrovi TaxID=2593653 RepID=A0A7S8HDH9_9HYPH|nr:hypothetical protein [Kaustia mangrovi]QPC44489.1 hypothetical protein HW532_18380 [Kaustia mangrovi]
MLSHALEALRDRFRDYEQDGMAMEPEAVRTVVASLTAFQVEARNMEETLAMFRGERGHVLPFPGQRAAARSTGGGDDAA